jgi:hypothetical protein
MTARRKVKVYAVSVAFFLGSLFVPVSAQAYTEFIFYGGFEGTWSQPLCWCESPILKCTKYPNDFSHRVHLLSGGLCSLDVSAKAKMAIYKS